MLWSGRGLTGPLEAKTAKNAHFYKIEHVMRCLVHFPEGYDGKAEYVLVIALHGRGGSARDFDHLWEKVGGARCIMATPEGPYILPFEQRRDIPGHSWDIPVTDPRIWAMADPLVVDGLVKTVKEIREHYRVGKVYIMGFSQGAAYAYMAAIRNPDIFSGALALAGNYPGEFLAREDLENAKGKVRIFIAHARNDKQVPYKKSAEARETLEKLGFKVDFHSFLEGHSVPAALFEKALNWTGAGDKPPDQE